MSHGPYVCAGRFIKMEKEREREREMSARVWLQHGTIMGDLSVCVRVNVLIRFGSGLQSKYTNLNPSLHPLKRPQLPANTPSIALLLHVFLLYNPTI